MQTEIELKYTVYGIYDNNDCLKYVGCTQMKLKTRLQQFFYDAAHYFLRKDTHYLFFKEYTDKGEKPTIKSIRHFSDPKEAGAYEYKLITETPNLINRSKRKQKIYQGYKG